MTNARDLYCRWINELWAGKPGEGEIVSDDFVGHWPNREVRGPAELASIIGETQAMFETLTFEIEVGPLVDGDLVAGRWRGVGRSTAGDLCRLSLPRIRQEFSKARSGL